MNFVGKQYKAYEYFVNFINGIDTEEYQNLANLITPMLFKENYHKLYIGVGSQSPKSFTSWLSTSLENFIFVLSTFNEEPQLIIKSNGFNIASINLALITSLHINTHDNPDSWYYDIEFRYNNEIDYKMRIVVKK